MSVTLYFIETTLRNTAHVFCETRHITKTKYITCGLYQTKILLYIFKHYFLISSYRRDIQFGHLKKISILRSSYILVS